ncbi:MAG: Dam family site-specific DNA-(adenine-N6)-methyltransferase [Deltaproteobacteria bacterium]|nr:Dam family site-specific DNA-(adenine-N6)-methyltransferase [Deltaproteobacteria bacterium]
MARLSRAKSLALLRWPGSKRHLVERVRSDVPWPYGRYFEPMLGSGRVFFGLQPARATLSDTNAELINCYRVVRDSLPELLRELGTHTNSRDHYDRVRAMDPERLAEIPRAARTIFLNRAGFNGLYRVNRLGEFNVPWGQRPTRPIIDLPRLRAVRDRLRGDVHILHRDFGEVVAEANRGDFVYFDPPYAPDHRFSRGFGWYSSTDFGEPEHRRLAKAFRELDARGCFVLLSNSDVPLVRELFDGYRVESIEVRRPIAAQPSSRDGWREVLIANWSPDPTRHSAQRSKAARVLECVAPDPPQTRSPTPPPPVVEPVGVPDPISRIHEIRLPIAEAALALFGLGTLSDREAAQVVSGALQWTKREARSAIREAVAVGALVRPHGGAVRVLRPDATLYLAEEWLVCLEAVLPPVATPKRHVVDEALAWAREQLGLATHLGRARSELDRALHVLIASGSARAVGSTLVRSTDSLVR